MTVIENINIAYVSQDLSLLSSADADATKDLRYLSVFAIGCMILPLREDRRKDSLPTFAECTELQNGYPTLGRGRTKPDFMRAK